jgi:hypothetical protein
MEIYELPAARGCTYVVPASDFALALQVGQPFAGADFRVAAKLGVTGEEIERLCDAVLGALRAGPLDPDGIRAATGSASRSLGEEGKKKGVGTTLPIALGRLQARGRIRRVPANGRLDQQRYAYALWSPGPLEGRDTPLAASLTGLARDFFRTVGPATLAEFQWFSAQGVKAAKEAVAPLGLVPIEEGSERLLLPGDVDAFRAFAAPAEPQYALVSSLDPVTANRRDVRSLVAPEDAGRLAPTEATEKPVGALVDLPSHAILDRGRLIGFWEYDADAGEIVWATFDGRRPAALREAVARTEAFVRDELGDARSFSLDSPKSRAPRIEALRRAAEAWGYSPRSAGAGSSA